jgi:membrane protein
VRVFAFDEPRSLNREDLSDLWPRFRTERSHHSRVDGTHAHDFGLILMSQLAAEGPAHPSSKATLGGLIKSALIYGLVSVIPPAKPGLTVLRPKGGAGAAQSDRASPRSGDVKQDDQAAEDGRGRHASSPWEIPWAGWKDILWRTYARIGDDRLLAVAAGVVFYGLLAIFPAITALVSLYGLFAKASTISEHLSLASGVLPAGGMEIIQEQINRITAKGDAKLSIAFASSLGLALWSANAGMKAVIDALNVTYGEKEKRSFIKLNVISLAFTIGALLFLVVALAAITVLPVVLNDLGLATATEWLVELGKWPLLLIGVALGIAFLYRNGPSREKSQWRWVTWGSAVVATAWLVMSLLFSWYSANFGSYDKTYGSLGAAIGFMTWMWLSSTVILVGAELDAEMEHQTNRDTTTGAGKPMGSRGAQVADTVGLPTD